MNEPDDKFRLEDEPEDEERKPGDWWSVPAGDADDDETIDDRTVKERRGDAVDMVAGRRPPPEGWPLEALAFPLRRPGPRTIVLLAVLLGILDLAGRANLIFGLLLKLVLLPVVLRWQFHTASMTAAGEDRPPTWSSAMGMRADQIRGIGILLAVGLIALLPGLVALWLGSLGVGLVLLAVGGVWIASGALGQAVGQPALIQPWHAVAWFGRHPAGLLLATFGWWAAGVAEYWAWALTTMPIGTALALGLGLRLCVAYVLLVSARALGVVGRSWSAWDED